MNGVSFINRLTLSVNWTNNDIEQNVKRIYFIRKYSFVTGVYMPAGYVANSYDSNLFLKLKISVGIGTSSVYLSQIISNWCKINMMVYKLVYYVIFIFIGDAVCHILILFMRFAVRRQQRMYISPRIQNVQNIPIHSFMVSTYIMCGLDRDKSNKRCSLLLLQVYIGTLYNLYSCIMYIVYVYDGK